MADPSLTRDGEVFVLSLGADENRLHQEFLDRVGHALDEVEATRGPAALVTTGEGKFFSNGFDLDWLGALGRDEVRKFLAATQKLWARILTFPVPTVAAINGHAFGAGAVTALAHDYRHMREDRGYFCFPEVDIGLRFRPGMMALLQCRLSPGTCRDAVLTGARYGGREALERGIVDDARSSALLREGAISRAAALASKDRETLRALKLSMYGEVLALLGTDSAQPSRF